jgi:hypothetical protein
MSKSYSTPKIEESMKDQKNSSERKNRNILKFSTLSSHHGTSKPNIKIPFNQILVHAKNGKDSLQKNGSKLCFAVLSERTNYKVQGFVFLRQSLASIISPVPSDLSPHIWAR